LKRKGTSAEENSDLYASDMAIFSAVNYNLSPVVDKRHYFSLDAIKKYIRRRSL